MNVINQFSYPLIAIGLMSLAYLVLRRRLALRWVLLVEVAIVVIFTGAFIALRPGEGDADAALAYDDLIGNGRPTMIEFFSNFCTVCLVFRPQVDAIAEEFGDDFNIMRVNIHTESGLRLRDALAFSFTPEFILIDAAGNEVWRDHAPPSREQLVTLVAG